MTNNRLHELLAASSARRLARLAERSDAIRTNREAADAQDRVWDTCVAAEDCANRQEDPSSNS